MDRADESIWDRRAEGFRRKVPPGYRSGGDRDGPALQSGTDQRQSQKFKLIKRSMYGRGTFDLLRQRILYAAS